MSWLKLKRPMDEYTSVDLSDIVPTKRALKQLGYYQPPIGNELGAWVDNNLFDGIRRFQRDNRLRVDGVMKPGGPTETAINRVLSGNSANRGPINAKSLLDQFDDYTVPGIYNDPRDGKCRATGTCDNMF
ncbi:MAG: peptidoglycan-binding protein [Rhodospirillales bacterium]|jgi:hypothetical protein|nr:peptidoglycan-binding protein [Rhodospirillales bacterium]